MDVYGVSAAECFPVDDLLDFSNDQLFTTTDSASVQYYSENNYAAATGGGHCNANQYYSADFTHDLCVPTDDVAELEWLSNFVDDSFTYFPSNSLAVNVNLRPDASSHGRSRSKRSRAAAPTIFNQTWTSSPESAAPTVAKSKSKRNESSPSSSEQTGDRHSPSPSENSARRCTHCASEKTPQWRAGPLGPKTLCNACGVRYKSGRLVPEYRPAASPTFVLTQHSNSHRKVMELRRQKEEEEEEEIRRRQQQHHSCRDFEVC
ncbi:hypothetical protein RHGRI_001372 [Rhododendron griersonianum]|uniref:GATA transcription factor n=1 Tax=Rhododendron griersonianum TaxID=479676 RepID=A0AAV6LMG3_9ERIC|nr:hypothetical protein RHGRI_001372 [Rhododendron griersonianum]